MSSLKQLRVEDEDDDDDIAASAPAAPNATCGSDLPARYYAMLHAPPSEILPWLYLGTAANAANKRQLAEIGIKCILNLKDSNWANPPPDMKYLYMPMSDFGDSTLTQVAAKCIAFMERAKNKKRKILVHCRGGVNRSATIVLAYLLTKEGYSLKDAYNYVKQIRPQISPHEGYLAQLREYEKKLRGSISLTEADTGPSSQQKLKMLMRGFAKTHSQVDMTDASVSDSSDLAASAPAPSKFAPPPMLQSTTRHSGTLIKEWIQFRNRKAASEEASVSLDTDTEDTSASPTSSASAPTAPAEKPTKLKKPPLVSGSPSGSSSEMPIKKLAQSGSPSTSSTDLITPEMRRKKKKEKGKSSKIVTTSSSSTTSKAPSSPKPGETSSSAAEPATTSPEASESGSSENKAKEKKAKKKASSTQLVSSTKGKK